MQIKIYAWDAGKVCGSDKNNTFFLELPDGLQGKKIKICALFCDGRKSDAECDIYICDKH